MVYTRDSKSRLARDGSSSLPSGTKTIEPRACLLAIIVFVEGEMRKRERAPSQQAGSHEQGREELRSDGDERALGRVSPPAQMIMAALHWSAAIFDLASRNLSKNTHPRGGGITSFGRFPAYHNTMRTSFESLLGRDDVPLVVMRDTD